MKRLLVIPALLLLLTSCMDKLEENLTSDLDAALENGNYYEIYLDSLTPSDSTINSGDTLEITAMNARYNGNYGKTPVPEGEQLHYKWTVTRTWDGGSEVEPIVEGYSNTLKRAYVFKNGDFPRTQTYTVVVEITGNDRYEPGTPAILNGHIYHTISVHVKNPDPK